MIIDSIDNLGKYVALNPLFADVIDFLKGHDLQTLEAGKYSICGNDVSPRLPHPDYGLWPSAG